MFTDVFIVVIYLSGAAGMIQISWKRAKLEGMGPIERFCFSVIFCSLLWPMWLPYYIMTEVDF